MRPLTASTAPRHESPGESPRAPAAGLLRSRRLAWTLAGLVALLVGTLAWGLVGPEPRIVVGPHTTVVTAPLAADGLPDYEAALLAMAGPAPPPEENAAVELLQVLWPMDIDAADLPAVCTALGIPATPPDRPLPDPSRFSRDKPDFDRMFDASRDGPWTDADFPAVAAWLVEHAAGIDRLVAAVDRPHFWLPQASFVDGRSARLDSALLEIGPLRTLFLVLYSRANWHLGAGRHEAAWRDLRAVLGLGQRYAVTVHGMSRSITDLFVCAMHDGVMDVTTRHLLGSPAVSADVIATIGRDLDALGPPPGPAAALDGDRLTTLDFIVWIARREPGGYAGRQQEIAKIDVGLFSKQAVLDAQPWARAALWTSLDWNVVLERANALHDRYAAAASLPTHQERRAALSPLDKEVTDGPPAPPATAFARFANAMAFSGNRGWRSAVVGEALVQIHAGGGSAAFVARATEHRAAFDLLRTAAALAAWRSDQPAGGPRYPERLEALVPAYLPRVPLDPFADAPFIYERRGDGYLLASVGKDGTSDGGNDRFGWIVGGEWQAEPVAPSRDPLDFQARQRNYDIVIRVPWHDTRPPAR
jgi:hypothetical protein